MKINGFDYKDVDLFDEEIFPDDVKAGLNLLGTRFFRQCEMKINYDYSEKSEFLMEFLE